MGLPTKDEEHLKQKGIVYFDTPYKQEWQVRINAFRVGDSQYYSDGLTSQFYFDEKAAILDTYGPYILLPKSLSSTIMKKLQYGKAKIESKNGLMLGPCDPTDYNALSFFVNDRYFVQLDPKSFVIDIGLTNGKCLVAI